MLCCGYTLTDFPISIRLISLALWQSNDCPSASKATLMNMDKYFTWIHYERLHNHNKAKHNKTVCIFLGIYCICVQIITQRGDAPGNKSCTKAPADNHLYHPCLHQFSIKFDGNCEWKVNIKALVWHAQIFRLIRIDAVNETWSGATTLQLYRHAWCQVQWLSPLSLCSIDAFINTFYQHFVDDPYHY